MNALFPSAHCVSGIASTWGLIFNTLMPTLPFLSGQISVHISHCRGTAGRRVPLSRSRSADVGSRGICPSHEAYHIIRLTVLGLTRPSSD